MSILNPVNPYKSDSDGSIPKGVIVIWSGTTEDIPDGWHLCDGEDGTPNLRDRFVLGAGGTHEVRETGGEEEVTLTVEQLASHAHFLIATTKTSGNYNGTRINTEPATGQTIKNGMVTETNGADQPHNNMPPYYALCYIMKL